MRCRIATGGRWRISPGPRVPLRYTKNKMAAAEVKRSQKYKSGYQTVNMEAQTFFPVATQGNCNQKYNKA